MLLLAVAGCGRRARIIPRDRLADIYVDMFLADEWIKDHPEARRIADTTFFYEPIFRKHGYRFADYDASVTYYLRDPARFSKILTVASEKLKKRAKALEKEDDLEEAIRAFEKTLEGYVRRDFRLEGILRDSLALWPKPDSLAVRDSLPAPDSLAVPDSSAVAVDSLAAPERVDTTAVQAPVREPAAAKTAAPAVPDRPVIQPGELHTLPTPRELNHPRRRPASDRQ